MAFAELTGSNLLSSNFFFFFKNWGNYCTAARRQDSKQENHCGKKRVRRLYIWGSWHNVEETELNGTEQSLLWFRAPKGRTAGSEEALSRGGKGYKCPSNEESLKDIVGKRQQHTSHVAEDENLPQEFEDFKELHIIKGFERIMMEKVI